MHNLGQEVRYGKMDTKIIFIGNYKGGVGKTTSVLNFAEYFAKADKKILFLKACFIGIIWD